MITIADAWNEAYDLLGQPIEDSVVEQLVRSIAECEGGISEKSLLRGYIGYQFPCAATRSIDVRTELEFVLESDPGNTTACLYLSHYYYDAKRYVQAMHYLEQIDVNKYIQAGQTWRALKIQEMELGAQIHVFASKVTSDAVLEFVGKLRSTNAENVAVPSELVQALVTNKLELISVWTAPVLRKLVLELRSLIDEIAGVATMQEETNVLLA